MKKKGFTLVELLVVVALLSIIIAIAIPAISKSKESALEREKKDQIERIESAAVLYAQDEKLSIALNETVSVTVKMLIDTGYINSNVNNGEKGCVNINGCLFDPQGNNLNAKTVNLTKPSNKIVAEYQE